MCLKYDYAHKTIEKQFVPLAAGQKEADDLTGFPGLLPVTLPS